ncbi:DinB family protein [Runella slithyformis]|uniref:DinB family protein n=1 Tax=Runella slithyformis (strain ATCC 29530 / DSM 19594 / LMG 11500 / NCIMB 11436 / LSU 4) TaxID=761193 RepID=A0A7U4E7B6_RUNSL|nr:DinB family protein [Runella slithyformis]AEI50143.1 DinB family protein [Runella slithyformis DSM 19594]
MKAYHIRLLQYDYWANLRIIEALEKLDTPPERAVLLTSHILNAQMVWFTRLTNDHLVVGVWDLLPVSWLKETADLSYQKWDSYVKDLDEADFNKIIKYRNTKGEYFESPIGEILTHLNHHAAYHRGQIIEALKSVFHPLPATDYILWSRE